MPPLTESTPLLGERQNGSQAGSQEEVRETTILKTVGATTLFLSTLIFFLIIGNYVIDNTVIGPVWYFTWYSEDAILTLATYMFCSILLSSINSLINISLAITVIADVIFSSGIIQAAAYLCASIPWRSSGLENLPPTEPNGPREMPFAWVIFVKVLMGTISFLGVAVGALYTVMLILRLNGVLQIFSRERFWGWKDRLLGTISIVSWKSVQQDGAPHQREQDEAEILPDSTPSSV